MNSFRPMYAPMWGCQYSMSAWQMAVISASQRSVSSSYAWPQSISVVNLIAVASLSASTKQVGSAAPHSSATQYAPYPSPAHALSAA